MSSNDYKFIIDPKSTYSYVRFNTLQAATDAAKEKCVNGTPYDVFEYVGTAQVPTVNVAFTKN